IQDAVVNCEQRKFQSVGNSDLVVHIAQVVLDHLLGGAELRRDLFVLIPLDDQGNDAQFLGRKTIENSQTDHIVFGEFAGNGDILDPVFTTSNFTHAIHQRWAGDIAIHDAVRAVAHIALGTFSRIRENDNSGLVLYGRLHDRVEVGLE